MNELLEILKYVLPSAIVMLTAFWLVKGFLNQEKEKISQRQKQVTTEQILKIRLQAYERVLLFLERIRPQNLIMRTDYSHLEVIGFQRLLLESIRLEYEHNLVQQLYISAESWDKLNLARNWVISLVNEASGGLKNDDASNDLAMKILESELTATSNPLNSAIDFVKNEVKQLF